MEGREGWRDEGERRGDGVVKGREGGMKGRDGGREGWREG